jgi:hypothetical protein
MPCGQFKANAVFFRIGVIAHNLYKLYVNNVLDKSWQKHNDTHYNYIKDIYRIEDACNKKLCDRGFCIILTNYRGFWKKINSKKQYACENYLIYDD